MRRAATILALGVAFWALACARKSDDPEKAAPAASSTPPPGVPVQVGTVTRASLADTVAGPGHTAALIQQKVRPPFAGTLSELLVGDGDRVHRGQLLATIVSRDSESALTGAREMARDAKTDAEKQAADRALALAQRGLVKARIESPADGVVLSHAAAGGDRVAEDQELLTIADMNSLVFLADVAQSDLSRIRPGQPVRLEIAGRESHWTGVVHDVLPAANPADFTAPVRIDLKGLSEVPPLGLFGTASITVAERRNVPTVPDAALVRDDISGKSRIALVQEGKAHWIEITPGLRGSGRTEIQASPLSDGQSVIVLGQVGLQEGAAVAVHP